MRIKSLKKNLIEVHTNDYIILVSYQTPVACRCKKSDVYGYHYKTEKKWSNTTTRHVNWWLKELGSDAKNMPQSWFDNLL
jgi:hypothetical protein